MPARVLLVDDEKGFVDTMAKRLENRGFTVGVAYDGAQALAALDKGEIYFDVVVLDVKMPGMDGNEVLKRIKAEHPLVEVVMLTGHATVESAIEGMKSGAFDYMMKPCNLDELMAKIGEAHDKKQAHEDKILEARARHIVLRRGD
ncbi:response regulator receiver protein [Pseudodesulfovibrio mercurii]|uniref:Response regulator receiver protein n=1 Tax=Pseudodesulfovibrio mercurii TaxID=641491 RepID=F0JJY1_9BACT|nr:response regulator [Pseudodesulfovibrio mercurii]EGB16230.1 response regulator receiver protein [Pseudodesulfovibrio mercurii]